MGSADRPEGLVRPFLNRGSRPAPTPKEEAGDGPSKTSVRSYLITGGRTHAEGVSLEFESILSITRIGTNRMASASFERAKVLQLCSESQVSVAEVAAKLSIPIGVTKVLCADLIGDGLLEAHSASADVASDVSCSRG